MLATVLPAFPPFIAAAALACAIGGAQAQEKAEITEVLRKALSVSAAQEVQVRRYDVPPGWVTPKHYHTGHMFLYVAEGTGAMETDGEIRPVRAGEVLNQFPERPMVMRNTSATERLKFVVFQVGATGAPYVVFVKPQ
jgi:quercetin dioxygenase-like cupin family protein